MSPSHIPERLAWAVDGLPARVDGPILEVGCGAGHALALLGARYPDMMIVGIDRSPRQAAKARERNADAIRAGAMRVEAIALDDAAGVFGAGTFGLVLAVNVNAFWTEPRESLQCLATLLAPGGVAHLVLEPPSRSIIDRLRATLPATLASHGFAVHATRTHDAGANGMLGVSVYTAC